MNHKVKSYNLLKPVPDLIFFTVSSKNIKFILKCGWTGSVHFCIFTHFESCFNSDLTIWIEKCWFIFWLVCIENENTRFRECRGCCCSACGCLSTTNWVTTSLPEVTFQFLSLWLIKMMSGPVQPSGQLVWHGQSASHSVTDLLHSDMHSLLSQFSTHSRKTSTRGKIYPVNGVIWHP